MIRARLIKGNEKREVQLEVVPRVGETIEVQGWVTGDDEEQEGHVVSAIHHLVGGEKHYLHIELRGASDAV